MLKFRTMHKDAHRLRQELSTYNKKSGPLFKLDNDPRLIKGGKLIAKPHKQYKKYVLFCFSILLPYSE